MSRYKGKYTLNKPFTFIEKIKKDVDIVSTVSFLSLQEQGFIPSSIDEMNEDICFLLNGEALEHIMRHEPNLYHMMNEWKSNRETRWEESLLIRKKQEEDYEEALIRDSKKDKYIFRTNGKRVVLELSCYDRYSRVIELIGDDKRNLNFCSSVIEVNDISLTLEVLGIKPGVVYNVE
jgi:hypothetical protein